MHSVNQIRRLFLDYYQSVGHTQVASAPLVPHNDPTLMFTNAGMVPFKDLFTGQETRDYVRATSSQKCVRAGGKHNDLDNVGYTARHHTFFEMLGNFSFGDYFKDEAIDFAWQLLTKELQLPKDKLLVTVYHDDDQAFDLWKKISGFSDDRIIRIKTMDNFWAMGDTGPCGPCSEIFYDHGEDIAGGPPGTADEDGDRFIEIWNLVFMQYETLSDGKRIDLPSPSIDTGMGLERISAVLQGVHDNYDIDLFKALIERSQDLSGSHDEADHHSHRVIADHLRSCSFLLADGVMPSNEGRGYVLRRIMRRAMRHIRHIGSKDPLMYQLVPVLIEQMGEAFPELIRANDLITEMLKLEEEKFGETLDRGLKLLDKEKQQLKSGESFSGDAAFKLYDTYGFPYDLTVDILRGDAIEVDEARFNEAMQVQKDRARAAWKGSGEAATESIWFDLKESFGVTEFLGYDALKAQGKIVAILNDGEHVQKADQGDTVQIILNQTPFYGESGGQEGDYGQLSIGDTSFDVSDVQKYLGAIHAHIGTVTHGTLHVDDVVIAQVNEPRRQALKANHSATHILHAVLREILGNHVTQKGSLVADDRLRFDMSHPKAVTHDELIEIEQRVNDIIRNNAVVSTKLMTPDDAIEDGALALFGEKYGDEVRVLSMGPYCDNGLSYSVELCGGTHVDRTGDIGAFKIISEGAIASGVRRIEAVTAAKATMYIQALQAQLDTISAQLKVSPDHISDRLESMNKERKQLEQELSKARKLAAMGGSDAGVVEAEEINGIPFVGKVMEGVPPKDLRDLVMEIQKKVGSAVVVVASSFDGKGSCIISVSNDLTDKVSAVDLIKEAAPILGAKGGGGKPNFAQTGGPEGANGPQVIERLRVLL